jgi:hypothetical protein
MATYDEMINQLSPEQVRQLFNQGYPSELPQSKTLRDYITPSSYVDPIAKAYAQQRMSDPISQMLGEQRFSTAPQDQAVAPAANRVSMPNLSGLTDYLPSMNTLSGLVPREIPNVFGVNNPLYSGLLGADQSQALSRQSNIAGLLGAAAALVQGMGKQGSRRSAAQNIISALGAGYGAAGQGYQQGLQNYGQAQQLAIQQRQQAGVQAMKMKYPDLADEFDTNPAGAFRIVSEREAAAAAARGKTTSVKPGESVIDARGNVIYTAPAETKTDKTSNIKNYEYYLSTIPVGQKPLTFKEFEDSANKAPSVTTNVNVSSADKKFGEGLGTATAAAVENTLNKARSAQNTLSTIATIKPLIQGEVFAGPLSESEATISRLGSKFGITSGSTQEKLNATAQAMQGLAQLELQAADAMKGQGAITDFERALIGRAAGGDLAKLTQKEVLGLLGALEKVSNRTISRHTNVLKNLRSRPDTASLADFFELEATPQKLKFNPATGKVE